MPAARSYLFVCLSGVGYLYPAIRLAHVLQARGERVLFVSTVEHALVLHAQGLDHLGVRNDGAPFLNTSTWYLPTPAADEARVLDQAVAAFRPDVLVGSPLALAAFAAAERHGLPLVSLGFAEYLYPGPAGEPEKNWRLVRITQHYNEYRAALGLGPVPVSASASPLIGDCHLLRSVPALLDHQRLPPAVRCVGALYWEPAYQNLPLGRFCAAARAAGQPLAYVQIGRLFEQAGAWRGLAEALSASGLRVLVDTGRADYLRPGEAFPDNFFVSPFLPLGALAAEVAFVVCSGQSTTVTSAILHERPLLCLPHSADSVELTDRLVRKGLALGLPEGPARSPAALARAFGQLLGPPPPALADYRRQFLAYDDEQVYAAVQAVFR